MEEVMMLASSESLRSAGGRYARTVEDGNSLLARCGDFVSPAGLSAPLQVALMPRSGWCFYHAVLHQLAEMGRAPGELHRHVLGLAMLDALIVCREQFEEAMGIEEQAEPEQRARRRQFLAIRLRV